LWSIITRPTVQPRSPVLSPGVTVLKEPRQGKVYARTTALDAARGDIIGRIDADTILPRDWSQTVHELFKDNNIDAVSGRAKYHDTALPWLVDAADHFFRKRLAYELRETLFLQGANMAIRRTAWQAVKPWLCADNRRIHEDFDIAIHLQQQGRVVAYEDRLVASLSLRCMDVSLPFFISYVRMNPHTYAVHDVPHYRRMYPVIGAVMIAFLPARTLFRGHNPKTGKFSLARLFAPREVNPRVKSAASNVYLS
jgi:glycosyltransferase involved in cell wall biosynthesis